MRSIVVFAKDPRPGTVKTRLTPFLSPEEAADLYQAFIRDTLHTTSCVDDAHTCVAFTPEDAETSLRSLTDNPSIEWFPQSGDTLGVRLFHAFDHAFHQEASHVVTVGSDCPALPPKILSQAFDALSETNVVLGPATDGGYYLIGLANRGSENIRYETLFENIAWSTKTVYSQTLDAIREMQLTFTELPEWSDVDQPEDLMWLSEQIQAYRASGESELAVHTDRMLQTLRTRIETVAK